MFMSAIGTFGRVEGKIVIDKRVWILRIDDLDRDVFSSCWSGLKVCPPAPWCRLSTNSAEPDQRSDLYCDLKGADLIYGWQLEVLGVLTGGFYLTGII